MNRPSLVALALVSLAAVAHAQPASPPLEAPPPADPTVSLTISPLLLLAPIAELTAELRVAPRIGLAVIGGIGGIRDKDTNDLFQVYEAGLSPRYYVTGSFRRGLQLGGEAMYVHVASDTHSVRAAGLALGGFVGYKWALPVGFTFEAQLGVAYLAGRGESDLDTDSDSRVLPLLNLNAGWSF